MKYTKITFLTAILGVALMVPAFASALTTEDNGLSGNVTSVPPTVDNGSSAQNTSAPGTIDNGSSAGTPNTPGTIDNGTSANVPSSTPAPTNPGNPGGSPSGGNPSSDNPGSGGLSGRRHPINTLVGTGCQLLSTFLNRGDSGFEVSKLQGFLKNQGFTVALTGIYDAQTVAAVSAFQTKYAAEILSPWGVSAPTGRVYMTTTKKINSLVCNVPLTLTPAELAQLNAYKLARAQGTAPVSQEVGSGSASGTVVSNPSDTGSIYDDSATTSDDTQVAAAAKSPIWSKIWNFIKRIFGR